MKITRKKFIGSAAVISGISLTGFKTFGNEGQPSQGEDSYMEALSPVAFLPDRTIAREGETTDDLTSFINKKYGIQNIIFEGEKGWTVQFKMTGYRGIPLWTVSSIALTIDGQAINEDDLIFLLDGRNFKVAELKDQVGAQWWVMDWATLFIPMTGGMPSGNHDVEITMMAVSIYNTSGTYREQPYSGKANLPVIVEEI